MKKFPIALALTDTQIAASAFADPQQIDPNMPGMASTITAIRPVQP